jgi:hypothetical protein
VQRQGNAADLLPAVFDLPVTLQEPVIVDAEAVPGIDIADAALPAAE